jgi:hypothetical protein
LEYNFIDFKNLITTHDESELIKESIVFASNHQYINEKVPKQYFNPFIDFIENYINNDVYVSFL